MAKIKQTKFLKFYPQDQYLRSAEKFSTTVHSLFSLQNHVQKEHNTIACTLDLAMHDLNIWSPDSFISYSFEEDFQI